MASADIIIRPAGEADLELLPEIEREAAEVFRSLVGDLGLPDPCFAQVNSIETFGEALGEGRLWVAVDAEDHPIGFALVTVVDGHGHLEELDVLPAHQRRGIGTALVARACRWAREAHYRSMTLSTFAEVPWNAPFYQKLDFVVERPNGVSPGLERLRKIEQEVGLDLSKRVIMRRSFDS